MKEVLTTNKTQTLITIVVASLMIKLKTGLWIIELQSDYSIATIDVLHRIIIQELYSKNSQHYGEL